MRFMKSFKWKIRLPIQVKLRLSRSLNLGGNFFQELRGGGGNFAFL